MGMTAEGELRLQIRYQLGSPEFRVMQQRHRKGIVFHSLLRFRQIATPLVFSSKAQCVIIYTHHHDGVGSSTHHPILVQQHIPSHTALLTLNQILVQGLCGKVGLDVIGVVVVAHDGIHSVLGLDGGEYRLYRIEL